MKHTLRLFSLVLTFVLGVLIFIGPTSSKRVHAATADAVLHVTPNSGTYSSGSTLTITVTLDTPTSAVSAVKVILTTSDLTYVSSDFSDSVFNSAITPLSSTSSSVSFTYGRFDTGYLGTGGTVAHLTFTVLSSGNPSLIFDQANSQVIAYSDSSNILNSVDNGSYTLSGAAQATASPTPTTQATAATQAELPSTGTNVLEVVGGFAAFTLLCFLLSRFLNYKNPK